MMLLLFLLSEVIIEFILDYYKNDKERLRERAKTKYGELPQEEKNMTREYGRNIFHNMSEEKKQKLKESQKNYVEAKKSHFSDP